MSAVAGNMLGQRLPAVPTERLLWNATIYATSQPLTAPAVNPLTIRR
jgi:hypothetical protein